MSPAEIVHRLEQRLRTRAERRAFRSQSESASAKVPSPILRTFFPSVKDGLATAEMRRQFPEGVAATIQLADTALDHRIDLFGQVFDCGHPAIDWHRDPRTGFAWPRRFYADIDIRAPGDGVGPLWVWRLGQHHHLTTLAKAYALTGDERYADEAVAQLIDWIQSNPRWLGIHWTSPLAMAIRLLNWCWTLAFLRPSPALSDEVRNQIIHSIEDQAGHIERHLSRYSSANNHLIGEAAGLAFVGLCFPGLARAEAWTQLGLATLQREIGRQILADGTSAEQATHYLLEVLDHNLLVWRLAEIVGRQAPPVWRARLAAAAEFLAALIDGDGRLPALGDSDDGCVVRLDDRLGASRARSIVASAAVILNRPDLKAAAGEWDEASAWLLGSAGRQAYETIPAGSDEQRSRWFARGGLAVLHDREDTVTFDAGPLGYLSTAAHGHADALSVTLALGGKPALVDPGTFAYQEGGEWRSYFRSTGAHNTVVVDQADQSQMTGTFLWGRKARARLSAWTTMPEADFVAGTHDGYARGGVTHWRSLLFLKPGLLLVHDRLEGAGSHHVVQTWHLPEGARAEIGQGEVRIQLMDATLLLLPLKTEGFATTILEGETDPIQGWVSPRYGRRAAAPVISLAGHLQLPAEICVAFGWGESRERLEKRLPLAHYQMNRFARRRVGWK